MKYLAAPLTPPSLSHRGRGTCQVEETSFLRRKILRDKVPVGQLVEPGGDVVRAPVLIVEIVGMLPDVDGEEAFHPLRHWRIGVRRAHDAQLLLLVLDQPCPAAAELAEGGG